MVNAFGINVLDTAQLDPGYVVELVERFDMAGVTIVEATHPDKAFGLAKTIQARRGDKTDILYRRWRKHLPDENMVQQTTSEEFVRYMQDVMEAGFVAAVYNEAQQSPMTPLTDYSVKVLTQTAGKGWRTVHFKTATGTPIGYKGEKPDGYAESDALWRKMLEVNKPRIDRGEKPLALAAPHAYFPGWGVQSGHTDRPAEIVRRLKELTIDPKYIPLAIGETGLQVMASNGHISDAEAGWLMMPSISPEIYAIIFGEVMVKAFMPLGAVAYLYAVGDQQRANNAPGMWRNFNLKDVKRFWDELERLMQDGRFQIKPVVTTPPVDEPPIIVPKPKYQPAVPPDTLEHGAWYTVRFLTTTSRNLRALPDANSADIGDVNNGDLILLYDTPKESDTLLRTWQWCVNGAVQGWLYTDGAALTADLPPPGDEPPDVVLPAPYWELTTEAAEELRGYYAEVTRLHTELATVNGKIADWYDGAVRLIYARELSKQLDDVE